MFACYGLIRDSIRNPAASDSEPKRGAEIGRGRRRLKTSRDLLYAEILQILEGTTSYTDTASAGRTFRRAAELPRRVPITVSQLELLVQAIHRYECQNPGAAVEKHDLEARWRLLVVPDSEVLGHGPDTTETFSAFDLPDEKRLEHGIVRAGGEVDPPELMPVEVQPWITARVFPTYVAVKDKTTGRIDWMYNRHHVYLDVPRGRDSQRNYGAAALIFDPRGRDGRPAVCLVAQHRFVTNRWAIEACRGFADAKDRSSRETAVREIREEALFYQPAENRLYELGRLYTDSGKLRDNPSLFLLVVDRNNPGRRLSRAGDALEAPGWYLLDDFYRAALTGRPIPIAYNPFDDEAIASHRPHMVEALNTLAVFRWLEISDSFTAALALRALPYFLSRDKGGLNLATLIDELGEFSGQT